MPVNDCISYHLMGENMLKKDPVNLIDLVLKVPVLD